MGKSRWIRAALYSQSSSLDFQDSGKLRLPLVTILNELLLVVEKLLVEEGGVFKVGSLHDGINGARLLTEATKDALGHVNVVLGGTATAIWSGFRLDDDSEGGTGSLAQFASDATLLSCGVAAQGVLSSEHGGQRSLLPRVMQDVLHKDINSIRLENHWGERLLYLHLVRKQPILRRREVAK